jgi:1-pyrroline-5-carboxylate dehydrogenase
MSVNTNAIFKLPRVVNEVNKSYAPGTPERSDLAAALVEMEAAAPFDVPAFVGGKEVSRSSD